MTRAVRWAAILVCASGVIGMIFTSIANNSDGALAFGLMTVGGALALLLLGAVAPNRTGPDPIVAAELEREIADLVANGTDEHRLRRLVRLARSLGP